MSIELLFFLTLRFELKKKKNYTVSIMEIPHKEKANRSKKWKSFPIIKEASEFREFRKFNIKKEKEKM